MALLEPFIDTVVVCTMTALVIVVTGAYENPAYADLITTNQGAALTARAFGEQIAWFPAVLGVCVVLFAFSTMISWSYHGERCWAYLFGDLMILGLAFPNLLGVVMLSRSVRTDLDEYWTSYRNGEFERHDLGRGPSEAGCGSFCES